MPIVPHACRASAVGGLEARSAVAPAEQRCDLEHVERGLRHRRQCPWGTAEAVVATVCAGIVAYRVTATPVLPYNGAGCR